MPAGPSARHSWRRPNSSSSRRHDAGVRIFAGLAPDLFAANRTGIDAFRAALAAGKFAPDLFHDGANYFQNRNVTAIVIEVPTQSIGDPAALGPTSLVSSPISAHRTPIPSSIDPRWPRCSAGQRLGRRASRPVGRVLCTRANAGRRPSIWDCHCWQPRAVYPRASGGPPSTARAVPLAISRPRGVPSDLAPGGVYLAATVTHSAGGLLHHRFTLTYWPAVGGPIGGLFSVALSRGSPRVGVTDHPALRSPDLPRRNRDWHGAGAAARPARPPCLPA